MLRCLCHVHTKYSFDSWLSPRKILAHAIENRVDVLIITDHNTLRGALEVADLTRGKPIVIIAGEYKTEKGDIIGLFLKEQIELRESGAVIQEIRRQGGLVLLPHPYKGHTLEDELLKQVDIIETYNSRCSLSENALAAELARRIGKPGLAGCDAHCAPELCAVVNEFSVEGGEELRCVLLTAPRSIQVHAVSRVYQPVSQMIKAFKTKDPLLFLHQVKRMASLVVEGG
jgi:predicted metal-dependent phosphoesterase TrpH